MNQRDLAGSLFFLALASIVLVLSVLQGIGTLGHPGAWFVPSVTCVLMIFFALAGLVSAVRGRSGAACVAEAWRPVRWRKNAAVLAALAVYVALLPYAGFLAATFLLMSVLFRLNALTVKAALLAACLSSGLAYGLFYLLLKTPLPRGIWGF
ncbi:MAG: hypothetical protein GXY72_10655 [Deltaproteobacteria bacterium]|nr:tripartite tricarboxylate transporter TctB family protein [Syntrophaceae bacterium]NLX52543.1 hypothetical protein [Deltaproteobacteria bacterium]